jgi:hypothetical protein
VVLAVLTSLKISPEPTNKERSTMNTRIVVGTTALVSLVAVLGLSIFLMAGALLGEETAHPPERIALTVP